MKPESTKAETDSRGFIPGLAALSRKTSGYIGGGNQSAPSNNGSVTATIGVRALSEAEIKSAKPNPKEQEEMHSFASSASRMTAFIRQGKLQVQQVTFE